MGAFDFRISDLDGVPIGRTFEPKSGNVTRTRNQGATSRITVPWDDQLVNLGEPQDTLSRVHYFETPIFWGPNLVDEPNLSEFEYSVSGHDPSYYWKRANVRYGDVVVDRGYPVDGRGLRMLVECAIPSPAQTARGVRGPMIANGPDTVPRQKKRPLDLGDDTAGDEPALGDGDDTDPGEADSEYGRWLLAERGADVYSLAVACASEVGDFDWWLEVLPQMANGKVARLRTAANRGRDRRKIPFHYGWGANNLEAFGAMRDGTSMTNYAVVTHPGGERDSRDTVRKALRHSEESWLRRPILQSWEAAETRDSKRVLEARAALLVARLAEPLQTVTFQTVASTNPDEKPFIDYDVGDEIVAIGRQSGVTMTVEGTIETLTLAWEGDEQTVSIDVVPLERYTVDGGDAS